MKTRMDTTAGEPSTGRFHLGVIGAVCIADARGKSVRVERGAVWLTEDGNPKDFLLRAGDTHRIGSDGVTVATVIAGEQTAVLALVSEEQRAPRTKRPFQWRAPALALHAVATGR